MHVNNGESKMFELNNKVVLITGATGLIGRTTDKITTEKLEV